MSDVDQSGSQGGRPPNGGSGHGGSVKEVAGAAAEAAKSSASDLASTVQAKVSEQVGRGKSAIGDAMGDLAAAVRKAAEELNQNQHSKMGGVVMQGADSLQSLSRAISEKQPSEFIDVVRDFGRKSPMVLVGGSILAGLALARFAKSSEPEVGQSGASTPPKLPAPRYSPTSSAMGAPGSAMGVPQGERVMPTATGAGAYRPAGETAPDTTRSGAFGAGA